MSAMTLAKHEPAGISLRMHIDPDRVFYCGDLGQPTMRRFGALLVQVSLDSPIRYRFEGADWQEGSCVVVQPYVRHEMWCDTRKVCNLLIEPETVDIRALPEFLRTTTGAVDSPGFVRRMRDAAFGGPLPAQSLDLAFFHTVLPRRQLDSRIEAALKNLRHCPNLPDDAALLAERSGLSVSRFLHLFKQETGCSFRALRAWKRARLLLATINQTHNLAQLAQDFGYPDSTHFSHSMRAHYGISPKNILNGCRRLRIVNTPAGSAEV